MDGGLAYTGIAAQTRLIEAMLDGHPDIDFIAGTAVSAEAAVQVLQKRNLEQRIKAVAITSVRESLVASSETQF